MAAVEATQRALHATHPPKMTLKADNTEKRDTLIATEKKYQERWATSRIFEADAPTLEEYPADSISTTDLRKEHPKSMITMAYPYMNGVLHAGHAFTVSKAEFSVGWARMQGKRALYPQGYHCTGMPIKACADKLVREIEMFGQNFERCPVEVIQEPSAGPNAVPASTQKTIREDVTKFGGKKSKTAAKTNVALKYQFQIMLALGLSITDIHKFADPHHWLQHFPYLCQRDLTNLGCRIDWRRSMVTTDANPYYDSFVRWQMRKLKDLGKIKFGKRYTIYSPKDGQACLDHDRQTGEGVTVQEYTALKMLVKEWAETAQGKIKSRIHEGASVYFVPTTLRPETMYGQVACFVGPNVSYGIYEVTEGKEYYFLSDRAAWNMAYQGIFQKWGVYADKKVVELEGHEVIGTLVNAPLSVRKEVRILPMETVKATKGTGVVTSVPSDSPDDYITMMDLAKKVEYYKIKKEWAEYELIPIVELPTWGNLSAKRAVEEFKIASPKEVDKLAKAKEVTYLEANDKGKMVYGEFAGTECREAKLLIHKQLEDAGEAFKYGDPDGVVISRSGDECVAAHLDQWFLNYGVPEKSGDETWKLTVSEHVANLNGEGLNTFSTEVKNQFAQVLNWLSQWACARSYGLGTRLPWDETQLVESLSDSTIYMSYYTIAHLLHKDIFGKDKGPANIDPEQMTDDVWDHIFCRTEAPPLNSNIPKDTLERMRREFQYWYPLDMRVSAKDLIQNHLTFFLYIHIAMFPPEYWPKAIRINGHLMLNGQKMSKSTGNFMSLSDSTTKFGADATRIAMADAGDSMEDANFDETVANSNILRLYELRQWCESVTRDMRPLNEGEIYAEVKVKERHKNNDSILRTGPKHIWDQVFENELYGLVRATGEEFELTNYKAATKSGLYDFTGARDFYREITKAAGIGMHQDCVKLYVELQALMLTVVAPHWSEYVWLEVLNKPETIHKALFPEVPEQDIGLTAVREYVRTTSGSITSAEGQQLKKLQKGKVISYNPKQGKKLSIYVALSYPSWQDNITETARKNFANMKLDLEALRKSIPKADIKRAMPFVQTMKKALETGADPNTVFERNLPFDEIHILQEMVPGLKQTIEKCQVVEVIAINEGGKSGRIVGSTEEVREGEEKEDLPPPAVNAVPGQPTFFFENV